jgi:16S rRNA (guanine1207-N2)-methyltransferase
MIPAIRAQERLLLDLAAEIPDGRLLCNTAGRAQFAAACACERPHAPVTCWFLDLYQCEQSRIANRPLPANLQFLCLADPPAEPFDVVAWAFYRQGDGELVREMLQIGHERLTIGGRLIAAIDNPRDQWLHHQLQALFPKVTRRPGNSGVVYLATKVAPLKKWKDYAAEFAFRDGARLIHLRTRPGVFSHRRIDGGARALIKSMRLSERMRLLDIGCGSGAVSIAAALRGEDIRVAAIDSNPRAVESAGWAAGRNAITTMTTHLASDGNSIEANFYDFVVANPPYYSDFQIARLFLKIAARGLQSRGRLLLVTKAPEWYADHIASAFDEAFTQRVGNYVVVSAKKR